MDIRIHKIRNGSRANGPGLRNVVWFQGCTLNCRGCFNPQTHHRNGGESVPIAHVYNKLMETACDGISISGGEPFQQPEALLALLQMIRENSTASILVFSGYPYVFLKRDPLFTACLDHIDALICGPYRDDLPPAYERFCSSSNQELILLTGRYTTEDFANLPIGEYFIEPDGELFISGICSKRI